MTNNNFVLIQELKFRLNQTFPLGLIPRKRMGEATGGILNPRTLANEDCLKTGIEDPVMVGRQVCYRVNNVVDYLEKKISLRNLKEAI